MKRILIICVVLSFFSGGFVTANATTSVTSLSCVSIASSDWDKLLDEYEQFVEQYIKTYKKAMNGDMAAMTEYAKLAEKAQKLSSQLEKAKGEMTAAQLNRYLKITQKLASAVSNL